MLLFIFSSTRHSYKQVVVFLDVGQGSSVLFQNHKCQILFDFGNSYKTTYALGSILKPHDKTIEYAFISHMDKDHYAGLINLSYRYSINQTYVSQFSEFDIRAKNIHPQTILAPTSKTLCGANIRLVWPDKNLVSQGSKNENSQVILLEFNSHVFLLTADIGCVSELQLIKLYPNLTANVLQSGHHGSKHSNCLEFLKKIQPSFVVTQAGYKNRYNHPHIEFLDRLKYINTTHFRTDLDGDIIFDVSKPQLQVNQNLLKLPKRLLVRFRELVTL